jgi:transposase-like protein
MDDLARRFRLEAGRRQGLRYSPELRQLAVQYAAAASGMSRREVAVELGLSEVTLARWLRGQVTRGSAALHEVVVVEQVGAGRPVLVMPSGVRVEGLSVRELVSVLEALG